GPVGEVYAEGRAHAYATAARRLTVAGAACTVTGGTRWRRLGGLLLAAGAAAERFAVFHAGVQSTEDPAYVVETQNP
ncbi:MAG: polysulfide reductase, partial [Actinomycetota bacterium]|nr:polysulfide reductase [Actinomycetota bacterium]